MAAPSWETVKHCEASEEFEEMNCSRTATTIEIGAVTACICRSVDMGIGEALCSTYLEPKCHEQDKG